MSHVIIPKEFDLLVFISRAGPPHNGHYSVVKEALKHANQVLILIGSSNVARSIRNPFTAEERIALYRTFCPDNVAMKPLNDHPYAMAQWLEHVQEQVYSQVTWMGLSPETAKIGLIGYSKDASSYYLKRFPQWKGINAPAYLIEKATVKSPRLGVEFVPGKLLNATDLRRVLFDPYGLHGWNDVKPYVPEPMLDALAQFMSRDYLDDFLQTPVIEIGQADLRYEMDYKERWAPAPWKPTFTTVDAVVVQSGHVLMVRRAVSPGKGLWALPGGFVEQEETLEEAVLRELNEETNIQLSEETLRRTICARDVFDDPWRSIRGRTITHAYTFDLRAETRFPKVKGGDDADNRLSGMDMWKAMALINPRHVYEDHYHIMHKMANQVRGDR